MGKVNDISTETKKTILQFLLLNSTNGKINHGIMKVACSKFSCSRSLVGRIWATARKKKSSDEMLQVQGRNTGPRQKRVQIDLELIGNLELFKRSTVRRLAKSINCSKSTVWRWIRGGLIISHSNAIKPDLTAPNKLLRLSFSLEALQFHRMINVLKFKSMYNTIHIDEKWFYISKTAHRFYLTPEEAEPHRTCKSKKFITKVMFMCAVSRPIFGSNGNVIFDGKIGIFPFVEQIPAKRNSKNRLKGTLETKPIQSINKDVIKGCLIEKIIPAIMCKWPKDASKLIFIQQDNAKPHIKDTDPDFRSAASANGFDIRIVHQPPNSPDMNVNDLGWFRAIQSIQTETSSHSMDELVNVVIESFNYLSPMTLNKVFLSLQGCMVEILKVKGQNSYKVPHMKKDALIRANELPNDLEVPSELVRECINYMLENGRCEGIEELMYALGMATVNGNAEVQMIGNAEVQM